MEGDYFWVPAVALLRGKDGAVFDMTWYAWRKLCVLKKGLYTGACPELCAELVEALEERLAAWMAERVAEQEDVELDELSPDPVDLPLDDYRVRSLIDFLRSCGGFTVEKVP